MAEQKEPETDEKGSMKNSKKRIVFGILLLAAAATVLTGAFLMPVLRIYGASMTPTLEQGDIVVSIPGSEWQEGNIIAFSYHNKILIKRLIAGPGCRVDIDEDGVVYVNKKPLDEPYVAEGVKGNCSMDFPCTVPQGHYFVLGDCRSVLTDSRSEDIGCVPKEQVIGRVVFRLWQPEHFGLVK